jgi:hypothetical protein
MEWSIDLHNLIHGINYLRIDIVNIPNLFIVNHSLEGFGLHCLNLCAGKFGWKGIKTFSSK